MVHDDQYTILNTISDSVLVIDQDYTIVFANRHFLELCGAVADKVIGGKCYQVLHHSPFPCADKSMPDRQCIHKQIFETGLPATVYHPHTMADGSKIFLEISASPVKDDNGTVARLITILKDITAQNELRQALDATLGELEAILNNVPCSISYLDPEMRVIKLNAPMEHLVGCQSEEVKGRYCYDVWGQYAQDDSKKGRERICDACKVQYTLKDGQTYNYERKADERYVEVSTSPVRNKEGRIVGSLECGQDITQRKRAEETLYAYERIISTTQDLMAFVGGDYIYQAVNDAYCKRFKTRREEIIGHSVEEILGHDVFSSTIKDQLDLALSGEQVHYETWIDYPVLGSRSMEVTYSPFVGQDGIISGVVANVHDITERKQAENALAESRRRYQTLFTRSTDAIFVSDMEGRIIDANDEACRSLGYTFAELTALTVPEVDRTATIHDFMATAWPQLDNGSTVTRETVHTRKDGSSFAVEIHIGMIEVQGQDAILGIARDITERKKTEEERIKNDLEWSTAMDASPDAIYLLDLNRHLLRANKSFYLMTGVTPQSAIGIHIEKIVHPEGEEVPCTVCQAQEEKRDAVITMEPEHPDNPTGLPIGITVTIVKDDQGQPLSIFMRLHDLTAQRKIETELRKVKDEWESTFNAMSDIVTIQDTDLRIVRANRAACDFFEVGYEDLIGRHCYQVFRGINEPCLGCPLLETLDDIANHSEIIQHDNLGKTFLVSSAAITDKDGAMQFLVHIARDITEQQQLEEELFQAHKMEAIGTLAGGIAHDFNNILTAIIGFTELAKMALPEGSSAAHDMAEVLLASQRATGLVKQILTFSRKGEHKREALQPYLIVKEALKLMRASLPTTIEILENIDPQSGTILAEPTKIHQIMVNLCTNALHAMAEETGTLKVTMLRRILSTDDVAGHPGVAAGLFIELAVSDTGCGMDQQTQQRIFEPYFTTKATGKGTGLGLAVVLGIVQDCGGMILVDSEPGRGTTIHVYFPAIIEEAKKPEETEEEKPLPTGTERILIVDDEGSIVALQKAVLSSLGYTVTAKTKSDETLAAFKGDPQGFDLLITDQTMPTLSGAKLAQKVLSIRADMPIILCTGYSSTLSEERALAMGIKKYVMKPVDIKDLARTVREALDG